jgi:hypothetical protein
MAGEFSEKNAWDMLSVAITITSVFVVVRRDCDASNIQSRRYFIRTCVYLKDLFDPLRNLCLFVHDCLFDRKLNQSVVCLIVHRSATIHFAASSRGGTPKIARLLARNIPAQICYGIPRTHTNRIALTRLNALRANAYYKNCCGEIPAPRKLKSAIKCCSWCRRMPRRVPQYFLAR